MAQTNFTPISLYYSSTASAVPTAGNLVAGELAINTADGRLYYKDSAGVVQVIAGKGGAGVAGGSNTQVQYNSSGSLAGSANMTFDGTTLTTAGLSDSGNLTFTGTGNRITGDFSNGTLTSRVAFQTSTTNTATWVNVLPNGTATSTFIQAYNNSDPTNSAYTSVSASSTESQLTSGIRGTGTFLPLTMLVGGSERLRIDTSGNVGIGTTTTTKPKLTIQSTALTNGYGGILVLGTPANNNTSNYEAIGTRIDANTSSAFSGSILLSRANTAPAAITTGMNIGRVAYGGSYDGTLANVVYSAQITGISEGTFSNTSAPTGLAFYTTPSGTAGVTTTSSTESGLERMRIDGSGNVGIGTSSPTAKLDVYSATGAVLPVVRNGSGTFQYGVDSGGAGYAWSTGNAMYYGTQGSAATLFYTNNTERMRITSSGNLLVGTTTNNTSGGVIQVSNGITFPATQSASSDANTLDDYEEGTWTPSLTSTTGTLTTVVNGTGYYTKVGRVVTIVCRPVITTNGTGNNALRLGGLPFAALETTMLGGASREDAVVGWVFGMSANTSTQLYISKYDNTYPGGNGHAFPICLTYTTS